MYGSQREKNRAIKIKTKNLSIRITSQGRIVDITIDEAKESIALISEGEILMIWDRKAWKFHGGETEVPDDASNEDIASMIFELAARDKWERTTRLAWIKNGGEFDCINPDIDKKIMQALS